MDLLFLRWILLHIIVTFCDRNGPPIEEGQVSSYWTSSTIYTKKPCTQCHKGKESVWSQSVTNQGTFQPPTGWRVTNTCPAHAKWSEELLDAPSSSNYKIEALPSSGQWDSHVSLAADHIAYIHSSSSLLSASGALNMLSSVNSTLESLGRALHACMTLPLVPFPAIWLVSHIVVLCKFLIINTITIIIISITITIASHD